LNPFGTGALIAGEADGVPVVLLHGFLGCARDFGPIVDTLACHHRCLALDLPGHGEAPAPAPGRGNPFFGVVDVLAGILELGGIRHFHVVGYSMGGRVALGLAVKYPDRVGRAVLMGSSPGLETPSARQERAAADRARADSLEQDDFDRFLSDWYDMPLFGGLKSHPGFADMLARRRHGDPRQMAAALRALSVGVQPSLWPDLADLSTPLRVLAGERDPKYVALAERMATEGGAIECVIVPDAGHSVHIEQPDAVSRLVREFLRD
jgi:2-succinyl-6-hydroxy-2,4-cyclohexadiene-1-carboxylate synthase